MGEWEPSASAWRRALVNDPHLASAAAYALAPAPAGQEGLTDRIDKAAEIGLWDPKYRQRIVDAARGARDETKEAIFANLNEKWADAKGKTS